MDELKSKFKRGCFPTEADYLLLIGELDTINSVIDAIKADIAEIKKNISGNGGADDPSTPDVPSEPTEPIIPDEPTEINEYLERYNWLQADGNKIINAFRPIAGSNTYKSKDVAIRAIIKVDSLTSAIGKTTAVCGASAVYTIDDVSVRYKFLNIVLYRIDETTFSVAYYGAVPTSKTEYFGTYHLGDTLTIEGTEKTLTINGVTYNKTVVEDNTKNLNNVGVLQSAAVLGDKPYNAQIARFEYVANGTTYSSLVPVKVIKELPTDLAYDGTIKEVGVVGMWDTINQKFLTSSAANYWSVNNYPIDGSETIPDDPNEGETDLF